MPVYIPHYINTEEFKDFINDSFVFQDDSLVRLAVEDVRLSGNCRDFVISLTLRRFMQTLIFQIINRLQFNKIGIKFQFYQLPRELPESQYLNLQVFSLLCFYQVLS
jgi:hypothetical protein